MAETLRGLEQEWRKPPIPECTCPPEEFTHRGGCPQYAWKRLVAAHERCADDLHPLIEKLAGLQRLALCDFGNICEMFQSDDGKYVRWADVEALLGKEQ
jgi:hypothetical protein